MGDSADNWYIRGHLLAGSGVLDVNARRHLGNQSIDAVTTDCTESQWYDIVTSARSTDTDDEFATEVAAVWSGWAATHLTTSGQKQQFRSLVRRLVDPQP